MNYLKELNAFHIRQETNPLTATAAYLWVVLMDVNNRTGWKKEFTVAASLLCVRTALKEGTFKRARLELQEKGYIQYKPQGANRAAKYQMISLISPEGNVAADSTDGTVNYSNDHSADHTDDCSSDPLFKQDNTKQKETNNTTTTTDAITLYQENFESKNDYVIKDLLTWVSDVGEPLVLVAMKRALERGKMSWGYAKAILADWKKKGIRTVESVVEDDEKFRNLNTRRSRHSYVSKRQEVVPDWFEERGRKQKLKAEKKRAMSMLSKAEQEAEEREVRALLAKHSSRGVLV